jgi:hypothetical protein
VRAATQVELVEHFESGLPDFSLHNIPKQGKNTKWLWNTPNEHKNIPNEHKNIPNGQKTYQHLPLQVPPNLTQIRIFGFENMPSGNPALNEFPDKTYFFIR